MRRIVILWWLCLFLCMPAWAAGDMDIEMEQFEVEAMEDALPDNARELMNGLDTENAELSDGLRQILTGAVEKSGGAIRTSAAMCMRILAIVLIASMISGMGTGRTGEVCRLAAVLAIGTIFLNRMSGLFTTVSTAVNNMSAFSGFLFQTMALTTAATGAVGSSVALYGITMGLCGVLPKLFEMIVLPAVSCYMAISVGNAAVGDDSLKPAANGLKQIISNGLKFAVIGFTAYLSLTGVVSGSADSAAVKAAKLAISSTVPVVGSMVADASETLLVGASVLRSGAGIFGCLGVLAISILPFFETGICYLIVKITAAAAGVTGEKMLSGLIESMAGAMGLIAAVTGAGALILMIGCVCFMRVTMG